MIRSGKFKLLGRFWDTILLCALLGMFSNVLGQTRILLNNYSSDCPIVDIDELATSEVFVEVEWQPPGGTWLPIQLETNGATKMNIKEPGFFDGGVGLIPGLPTGTGALTLCFQIRVWKEGSTFDSAIYKDQSTSWYQTVDLSANGTNNVIPTSLKIPDPAIWLMCGDCIVAQDVFAAIRGKGKIELYPLWPYPEGTSHYEHPWPPWGPVSLHAIADPGYRFVNWKGRIWDPDQVMTMPSSVRFLDLYGTNEWLDFGFKWGAANFIATFEPGWRLQVNVPYGGWVTNNPPGFDYTPGTQVTLAAKAKPFFEFSGWTGDFTGTNPTVTIQISTNMTAMANFRPISTPQLVIQPSVMGDGISFNGFGFTLLGTPGAIYSIESSPDLTNWTVFTHLTATNRIIQFTDTPNRNGGAKYYRAHSN